MNRLSIPRIEALEGFDRIEITSETESELIFKVIGKTSSFADAAYTILGMEVPPPAFFDGRGCILYGCNWHWTSDEIFIVGNCQRPQFDS